MAKSLSSSLTILRFKRSANAYASWPKSASSFLSLRHNKCLLTFPSSPLKLFSTTSTPYPLQYEMIISRPTQNYPPTPRRRLPRLPQSKEPHDDSPESEPSTELSPELSFEDWVDKKLTQNDNFAKMDKAKRKYYNKRRKRMYGTDSDDENAISDKDQFVELKPEVVELRTLHKREEELYFYDTFAYPWEKEKHYRMVYQLEKKYFPDHCLDKAFLEPGESNANKNENEREDAGGKRWKKKKLGKDEIGREEVDCEKREEDKGLIFFEQGENDDKERGFGNDKSKEISEKKVEEFFRCLKKVPNKNAEVSNMEPFLASRSTGLPPRWDSPAGSVVLVNKPKGWTSFTVCGKLRRLVQVKKVGHAGTLDPMATGLLIICVGKATKLVDRYQGMIKRYSGIFRLGEATSTWDADSPVIQREPWEHIRDADIKKTAASFIGEIWQVPPMFSAIKVGGEKMYDKARRGESIELSPRRISIFQFDIERSLEDRQNLIFRVTCSKGTYIRSLCADLGKALGSCAHLTALRREAIGQYTADDAFEFQELEEQITKGYL
ncbi:hypothetical protein Ancab_002725 [Ancistrocladus abbreviatus]